MARKNKGEDAEEEIEEVADGAEEDVEETAQEEASENVQEVATGSAEESREGSKGRGKRRVVRIRKSKKERENPLGAAIRLAVDSGKVEFGFRSAIISKAKAFVIATRMPAKMLETINAHSKTAGIPSIEFEGTPLDLGSACGKPFNISVLSIFDEGASNIMELAKKKK